MTHDFFAGIEQVEMEFEGGTGKFPVFYREARMFTVILPANWLALKRLLPDERFSPAQFVPGVGAVALTAFEYYDTDIAPYNEFSIGILLNSPWYAPVPGYNVLRQQLSANFNVFIHHLPVTTEVALRAGRDFYNYPKFLAGIDFEDDETRVVCNLSRDGERIMTVTCEKTQARSMGEMKFFCNLYQYRQPQRAEFKINVIRGAMRLLPGNVSWDFNAADDIGRETAGVVVGNRALMCFYMPEIQCILYGPEYIPIPLLHRTITSPGFMARTTPGGRGEE